ncbi:MAG: hypothetical protein PVJ38_05245 [Candidatus Bathyarchaeota archaeon]
MRSNLSKDPKSPSKSSNVYFGDSATIEVVSGWGELLERLEKDWEVFIELDDQKFILIHPTIRSPRQEV